MNSLVRSRRAIDLHAEQWRKYARRYAICLWHNRPHAAFDSVIWILKKTWINSSILLATRVLVSRVRYHCWEYVYISSCKSFFAVAEAMVSDVLPSRAHIIERFRDSLPNVAESCLNVMLAILQTSLNAHVRLLDFSHLFHFFEILRSSSTSVYFDIPLLSHGTGHHSVGFVLFTRVNANKRSDEARFTLNEGTKKEIWHHRSTLPRAITLFRFSLDRFILPQC